MSNLTSSEIVKCLENDRKIYGKPLPGVTITIQKEESILEEKCSGCDGRDMTCELNPYKKN